MKPTDEKIKEKKNLPSAKKKEEEEEVVRKIHRSCETSRKKGKNRSFECHSTATQNIDRVSRRDERDLHVERPSRVLHRGNLTILPSSFNRSSKDQSERRRKKRARQ